MSVEKAKFRSPVLPDCELHLEIEAIRSHGRVWKYKGVAKIDGKKVEDHSIHGNHGEIVGKPTLVDGKFGKALKLNGKTDFDLVSEQMKIKLDIIGKGIARLGMHTDQLDSLEVLDLFYSFYSPTQAKLQPLTEQALSIIHTALVQKGEAQ